MAAGKKRLAQPFVTTTFLLHAMVKQHYMEQTAHQAQDTPDIRPNLPLFNPNVREGKTRLPDSFQPNHYSVLIGRGKMCLEAIGNRRLKVIVSNYLDQYVNAPSRMEKSAIVSKIVDVVQEACPEGAFVKFESGQWWEVSDATARERIGSVFRDLLHEHYKSSSKAKVARRRKRRLEDEVDDEDQQESDWQRFRASFMGTGTKNMETQATQDSAPTTEFSIADRGKCFEVTCSVPPFGPTAPNSSDFFGSNVLTEMAGPERISFDDVMTRRGPNTSSRSPFRHQSPKELDPSCRHLAREVERSGLPGYTHTSRATPILCNKDSTSPRSLFGNSSWSPTSMAFTPPEK